MTNPCWYSQLLSDLSIIHCVLYRGSRTELLHRPDALELSKPLWVSRFGGFRLISQLRVGFGIILSFVLFFSAHTTTTAGLHLIGRRATPATRQPLLQRWSRHQRINTYCKIDPTANNTDRHTTRWHDVGLSVGPSERAWPAVRGGGTNVVPPTQIFLLLFTDSMFQILFVKLINGLWMRNQSRVSDQRSMSPGKHRYSSVLFSPTSEFVCESACRLLFYTHHRHSFILDPKDDTYQPCPKF